MTKPRTPTVKRPRKIAVAKPPRFDTPYFLQVGTPNEMGEPRSFSSTTALRKAANDAVMHWVPWCKRHNVVGVKVLLDFADEVNAAPIGTSPFDGQCTFDAHYNMIIRVKMWRTQ